MSPIPTNRARIFRRRFSLEAPPGAYDDVEALNPTMFLQLRYPIYRGEQVLFQDAACTVPVEVAGQDTIGGVKNPFTGAIIATQPTAAARPMWDGITVGATFDGTNHLVLESFTQPTTDATVLGRGKPVALSDQTLAATRDAGTPTEGGFALSFSDNTDPLRFQWVVNDQSANQDVLRVDSSVTRGVSSHFGAVLDSAATEERVYLDGSEIGNRSATVGSIESSGDQFFVGANSFDNIVPAINLWDGAIEWVSIHNAALTPTEINSTVDDGTTVDVRQITDWADAGTGTVDGELLLLTNSSNQDAIFQWDEAGSEWELVSTFGEDFVADSSISADFDAGVDNFSNALPTITGAQAWYDFRRASGVDGARVGSATDLVGSLDLSAATTANEPVKRYEEGERPNAYLEFNGEDQWLEASTASDWDFLHEGDGAIFATIRIDDPSSNQGPVIAATGTSGSGNNVALLFEDRSGVGTPQALRFLMGDGASPYNIDETSLDLTIDDREWHVVGVSWEGAELKFWLDGYQHGDTVTIASARPTGVSESPLHVGTTSSVTGQEWNGDIADVMVTSSGHPTLSEVLDYYEWSRKERPLPFEYGLVAAFEHDFGTYADTDRLDSAQVGNTVAAWQGITTGWKATQSTDTDRPEVGSDGIVFDGSTTDQRLDLDNAADPFFPTSDDFEAVVFVQIATTTQPDGDQGMILSQYADAPSLSNGMCAILYTDPTFRDAIEFVAINYDGSNTATIPMISSPSIDTPYMASIQRSGDVFTSFDELTQNDQQTLTSASLSQANANTIGGRKPGDLTLDGTISAIYVFDRPLLASEREALRDYAIAKGYYV